MKHKSPKQKAKDRAWELFSIYIRLRDCLFTTGTTTRGKCISCGVEYPFNVLQAGHFVDGRCNSILFSEEGVHAQCLRCNFFLNGNKDNYRKAILDLYGNGYDEVLNQEKFAGKKFTVSELEDLITELQEKIKLLEEK